MFGFGCQISGQEYDPQAKGLQQKDWLQDESGQSVFESTLRVVPDWQSIETQRG
jgi:hypothetical protein